VIGPMRQVFGRAPTADMAGKSEDGGALDESLSTCRDILRVYCSLCGDCRLANE
jgi:hypothetical protein